MLERIGMGSVVAVDGVHAVTDKHTSSGHLDYWERRTDVGGVMIHRTGAADPIPMRSNASFLTCNMTPAQICAMYGARSEK